VIFFHIKDNVLKDLEVTIEIILAFNNWKKKQKQKQIVEQLGKSY